MNRKKLSQTFRVCMALMLALFSTGITQVVTAQSASAIDSSHEVVCHRLGNGGFNAIPPDQTSAHIPGHVVAGDPAHSDYTIFATYPDGANWNDLKAGLEARCVAEDPARVTPAAPTMNDPCGTAGDTYTIPSTANVIYKISGSTVTAGTYPGSGSVTITAEAAPGYLLAIGATASWTFTFDATACVSVIDLPAAPSVTDPCGTGNATWNLPDDTATLDWDLTAGVLTVTIIPANTTFPGGATTHDFGTAVETNVDECEEEDKVTICHATSAVINPYNKISVSTSAADGGGDNGDHFNEHNGLIFDPATDVNGGDWGDIIPPIAGSHTGLNWTTQGQAIYSNGDCVYVPPTDFCPLVPGVQDDTTLCPPGQGGGQTLGTSTTATPTPPAPLPAALPATGDNDGPLALILAMITAYGATYFLQGRRQFGTSPHHAASHK